MFLYQQKNTTILKYYAHNEIDVVSPLLLIRITATEPLFKLFCSNKLVDFDKKRSSEKI